MAWWMDLGYWEEKKKRDKRQGGNSFKKEEKEETEKETVQGDLALQILAEKIKELQREKSDLQEELRKKEIELDSIKWRGFHLRKLSTLPFHDFSQEELNRKSQQCALQNIVLVYKNFDGRDYCKFVASAVVDGRLLIDFPPNPHHGGREAKLDSLAHALILDAEERRLAFHDYIYRDYPTRKHILWASFIIGWFSIDGLFSKGFTEEIIKLPEPQKKPTEDVTMYSELGEG